MTAVAGNFPFAVEVAFVDGELHLHHLAGAISFGFLSSLSNSRSTWQKSHSTPSDGQ